MNVLMITEKDAANASLARIAKEFLNNGDKVELYATYFNPQVLRDFPKSIPQYRVKEITDEKIDWCDIIVCSTLVSIYVPLRVFTARKPIFTHNYLMNRQINWGGDICFAPSQKVVASDYDEYLSYSYIGIGEPKYDRNNFAINDDKKRFLFIDSGHYPFSEQGKKELAGTLLHICSEYPDYELVIKPRFLPGDKVITHRNFTHLYDVIKMMAGNNLPNNLVMLDYHADLQELIDSASTVICMYTTAFVGAVVAGKGLIILENLPTTDVYDIRHKTYMRNRENMINSGALVDYRDVDKLLPEGAMANSNYIKELLEETQDVAKKIVEICYDLYKRFYAKGLFPTLVDSVYKNYKNDYIEDLSMTWEKMISRRCRDYMLLKSMILIDFHVKAKLDISSILENIHQAEDKNGLIDVEKFRSFLDNANIYRDECIIKNRLLMLQDKIDAGVLLNAYYLREEYEEIRTFPIKDIAAYNLYNAFVAVEQNRTKEAEESLTRYFEKTLGRQFALEISDMSNNRIRAFELLIKLLKMKNDVEDVKKYIEEYKKYYISFFMENEFIEPTNPTQKACYMFICDAESWLKDN